MTDAELQAYREKKADDIIQRSRSISLPSREACVAAKEIFLSGFFAGEALGRLLGRLDAYKEEATDALNRDSLAFNYWDEQVQKTKGKIAELLKEKP